MPATDLTLAWATDIHLDHVDADRAQDFCDALNATRCDRVLLGGDITNAQYLVADLRMLAKVVTAPISFVLGNHDYYGGSITRVRETATRQIGRRLSWLPEAGCVELIPRVGLVGVGGWGDASNGNHENSPVMLTDYFVITELAEVYDKELGDMTFATQPALKGLLRALGRKEAATLRPHLVEAADRCDQVIVLTHVPPWPEAAWHEGAPSQDDWLPGFTCRAVGEELFRVAGENPDTNFTVLCGHTHGEGTAVMMPNLTAHTQGAEYGAPGYRMVNVSREAVVICSDGAG